MLKFKSNFPKEVSYYIAAVFLCFIFLYWVMHLWSADFTIPFAYNGDSIYFGTLIKGTIDNGWYTFNPFIGMPTGLYLYDFPINWNLDMFIMKIISFIFPNWALTVNLYFLLTFPLTVITTLFVLRKMKVSPLLAIVGSLLFTFIPYHFIRGEGHLVLSAYYLIPLIILVIFWIFEDDFLLDRLRKVPMNSLSAVLNWKSFFSIIICIGIGSIFVYYPFFSSFFLLVAGICAAISRKKWIPLLNSLLLIGVIVLCVVAYNIPTLLYQFHNGPNELLMRLPRESEIYGLKIIQLLLPIPGHRTPIFAAISNEYARTAPLVTENLGASLGMIGSIGFIILIIWIFYRLFNMHSISNNETFKKINQISALNGAAVLLGTIGGFGTILAYLSFAQIRSYNRISIFIAFFSILTIVLLMDFLIRKCSFSKWVIWACIVTILFVGIYDQTSSNFIPDYKSNKEVFLNDKHFIENIETRFPADTMVFQLPYIPFPESPPQNRMTDYDLFRAYLHSKTIHWSYGAMKGRDGDLWQSNITKKPMEEMIQGLSFAGFNGIYVDSYGYEDSGKDVLSSISSILNETPLISEDGRLYFFDMTQYNLHLKSQFTSEEFEKQKSDILKSFKN